MALTQSERATYLFCAPLSHTRTTPLTLAEWQLVRETLEAQHARPKQLLTTTFDLPAPIHAKIMARRQLGIALYELENAIHQGFRVMFEEDMPARLMRLVSAARPPYLYYSGDRSLLALPHVLTILQTDLLTTLAPTVVMTTQVDEAVMAYLARGGRVIAIVAEGLNTYTRQKAVRDLIAHGQLVLLTMQPLGSKTTQTDWQIYCALHSADAALLGDVARDDALVPAIQRVCETNATRLYATGEGPFVDALISTQQATRFTTLEALTSGQTTTDASRFPELLARLTKKELPAWQVALYHALDEASAHVSKDALTALITAHLADD